MDERFNALEESVKAIGEGTLALADQLKTTAQQVHAIPDLLLDARGRSDGNQCVLHALLAATFLMNRGLAAKFDEQLDTLVSSVRKTVPSESRDSFDGCVQIARSIAQVFK